MKFTQAQIQKQNCRGTSLVEVLLTLIIVLALVGTAVINFTGTHKAAALREGAERFESLIQYARAESSLTGKKYRIVFQEQTNTTAGATLKCARLERESDPVKAPGVFEEVAQTGGWNLSELDELIGVQAVRPPGTLAKKPVNDLPATDSADDSDDETNPDADMASVTFYPDGSSDSAEIVLAPRDGEQKSRVALTISGVTGKISRAYMEESSENGMEEFPEDEAGSSKGLNDNGSQTVADNSGYAVSSTQ